MVRASAHTPKGCGFDSCSEHIPRLRVRSLVGACMGGNTSMFLFHIDVSISLPCPLSKITYPQARFKKKILESFSEKWSLLFFIVLPMLNLPLRRLPLSVRTSFTLGCISGDIGIMGRCPCIFPPFPVSKLFGNITCWK